ncbi:MAG TPA: phage Gp37/Gp68 family protein [Rhizomicrobium sp.]|jgi:protein gp37
MGAQSSIEWTDATWNPIRARNRVTGKVGWFCVHESEACRFCYAEKRNVNTFFGNGIAYKAQNLDLVELFLDETMLTAPLRWKKPRKIFVCSMTDLFGEFVPDDFIDRMFAIMALCPQHTFQVLTKRPERMQKYFADEKTPARIAELEWVRHQIYDADCDDPPNATKRELRRLVNIDDARPWLTNYGKWDKPLPNVWLGTSCEDQATADERIPHLLATPAAIRFLSCEPLLGPIDLTSISYDCGNGLFGDALRWHHIPYQETRRYPGVDWVICGGESGPHARPMHPGWARSLRDQCQAAGVPFFFKQWGEWGCDDGPPENGRDRIMDGQARCAWFDHEWHFEENGYAVDLERLRGCGEPVYRLGKKNAGRLLDGRTWDEFPEVRP